ncbi:MAG: hypothetical protein REI95_10900 [Oxalicibacterium faecigallinarum]|uniref:Uncharacterized protein n=1 Tax=Oxalicibacterium faecigallinarum TaxID=573741 RepID=A0A8J3EYD9_9BURK|nr:hypothetical protein [Oxalicibacterium faecigallinarum]MDQ7970141.1 hypothetical protein [Oxalicibacterium faecigallinarum]GGI15920.1 hypothetical protein GCM10008066_01370 [Oxalicibacterium faecigallinarum]
MPDKLIGVYNVSYSAVPLPDEQGWAAHLTIAGPSANPMHRNIVYPDHRISPDKIFSSSEEAEQAALHVAEQMVQAAQEGRAHD